MMTGEDHARAPLGRLWRRGRARSARSARRRVRIGFGSGQWGAETPTPPRRAQAQHLAMWSFS